MPAAFLFGGVSGFSQFLTELVGHWLLAFSRFPAELVVHSLKWATGSWLSLGFRAFSPVSDPASGPLFKVDHWLLTFPQFSALFPVSDRASGPLFKVDHWLLAFPRFSPLFPVSGRASGPLFKVDHWLLAFPN